MQRTTGRVVLAAFAAVLACALLVAALLAWRDAPSGALTDAHLLVDEPSPSGIHPASAAGGGPLGLDSSGCVTVGGSVLVAPPGLRTVGDAVRLDTIGPFRVGDEVPAGGGLMPELPASSLPSAHARCGPGFSTVFFPRSS